jgi:uncharacterized lipoprotein YbaY
VPRTASLFLAALILGGCKIVGEAASGGGAASARATGTVTNLQRIAPPPTAVIKARYSSSMYRGRTRRLVLGEQTIQVSGAGSLRLPYPLRSRADPIEPHSRARAHRG